MPNSTSAPAPAPTRASGPVHPRRRTSLSAGMLSLVLAAVGLSLFQIFVAFNLVIPYNAHPKNDLNLFLKFGRLVLNGQSPYQGDLPFIYQFWVSFFYLPFARLEAGLALHAWVVAGLLVLAGAVWLGWRAYLPGWRAVWLGPLYCLALALCSNAIITGHTTVITLTALAAAALGMRRGRYLAAGLPAFVLLIKPQLSFLLGLAMLALLFRRPARSNSLTAASTTAALRPQLYRWFAGAILGAAVVMAVSLAVQPDWPLRYARSFNVAQTQGELQADGTYLEYYKSILPSWLEFLFGLGQPWLGLISGIGIGGLLALGGWRLWQWRAEPPVYLALATALNIAVTPYSHVYDFPPLLLAIFVLLARIGQDWTAGRVRPALIRGGLLALLFAVQPLSADYRWFYSQALGITLLVLSFGPAKSTPPEMAKEVLLANPDSQN